MALVRLLVAAVAALAVTAGVAGAALQADPVTLSFRQYLNQQRALIYVWYGQVASGAAGDDVEVLAQECRTKGYRLFAATKTVAGGGFEVDSTAPSPFTSIEVKSGMMFRARWRDQLSNTVHFRLPLYPWVRKIPRKRAWKVTVNPSPVYMPMKGRTVVLQRQAGGKWVAYKRAKLVLKPNYDYGGATNHEAVFEVPARGLTLRAVLPAKSAAPCFLGSATPLWRS
jgi:hypothetical protein